MRLLPKANNQPLSDAGHLSPAELDELANPTEGRWKVVKHNPVRTVFLGRLDGQETYLKHFHIRSPIRRLIKHLRGSDAQREGSTSCYLNSRGVATPVVLAVGSKDNLEWIATRAVTPAERADLWHKRQRALGPAGRGPIRQAAMALAEMVARMHAAGVLHGDLHCGNVLIRTGDCGPQPVLMDLHRVRRRRHVSRRLRAANLAQLYHDRLPFTTRAERLRFLKRYLEASGVGGSLRAWQGLVENLAHRHARRQYAHRDRRILRRNRYFSPIRLGGGWRGHVVLATKTPPAGSAAGTTQFRLKDWQQALSNPQALLTGQAEVVKDSPSSQVVRRQLSVGPHRIEVFIKRARRKYARRWITDCFRRSRPVRAFALGHALLNRSLPTALPLAALERRAGPFLLDSLLITEAIEAPSLGKFLNTWLAPPSQTDTPLTATQRFHLGRQVLRQIGRLVRRLCDHGFAHRDLKAGNLLVRWSPQAEADVVLLDLEGLSRVPCLTTRQCFRGLMRLNVSMLEYPAVNHAARLRILMGLLRRPGCGRPEFKPYWRTMEKWSARKLRRQIRSRRNRQKAARRPLP